ncbi:basic amino acid ABC transporter substrate-binding protein [Eubacteriales bacterium OttesenSCG-928-N13]|nr:basic amino acid ABC transporter substrate-binding protein [Eubacteriales bacterium OttesenSCG-928-N13]
MKLVKVLALAMVLMLAMGSLAMAEGMTYLVGTNPEFAPFEFVGDDGEVQGIDVDIIKAIVAKVDATGIVQMESMAFDALIPALVSGKIDMTIAAMTITEERKQNVLFSEPYFDATQVIVVKEGSDIQGEADLANKKIGVQLGTTGDLYVTDGVEGADVQRFEKALDAIQDVASGRLDAVVVDEGPASAYVGEVAGLVILADRMSNEQYGIAMRLEDAELCGKVNEALAELQADGTLQSIIEAYQQGE